MKATFLLVLLLPSAASSGTFHAGPVVVVLENGRSADCLDEATGLCLVSSSDTTGKGWRMNANQEFRYLGVGLNDSRGPAPRVLALLPDHLVSLDARDLGVDQPVIHVLTVLVGNTSAPAPLDAFGVHLTREGYRVRYLGPKPGPDGLEMGRPSFVGKYGDNDGGVDYGRLSLPNLVGNDSTHHFAGTLVDVACYVPQDPRCDEAGNASLRAVRNTTPDVRYGATVNYARAEAATSEDLLTGSRLPPRASIEPFRPFSRLPVAGLPDRIAERPAGPCQPSGPLAFPLANRPSPRALCLAPRFRLRPTRPRASRRLRTARRASRRPTPRARHFGAIAQWSLLDGVMRLFEGRQSVSWSAKSYLVLPHLVEGRDLVEARAKSESALAKLGGHDFVLGLNTMPFFFAVYRLVAVVGVAWMFVAPFGEKAGGTTHLTGWEPLSVFGPSLGLLLAAGVVRSAMAGVIVAAAFVMAEAGTPPAPFTTLAAPPTHMESD